MKTPDIPPDEDARLAELRSLNVLDTIAEERFDRLTRMARRLFGVDVALVSLVDENRQWFKSCAGMELSETPRDISFCGHAILGDALYADAATQAQAPRLLLHASHLAFAHPGTGEPVALEWAADF